MDKKKGIGIGISILLLSFIFGCSVDVPEGPNRDFFFFKQPITMTNVKKEYSVGDLVFFQAANADKLFLDTATNTDIFVGNARFAMEVDIRQLEPLSHPDSAKHELNVTSGVLFNEEDFEFTGLAGVEYGCPEITYLLDYNIQFIEPGNYVLWLNTNLILQDIVFMSTSEDCSLLEFLPPPDDADLAAVDYFYEVDDVNLDVYQQYIADNGLTEDPLVVAALENKTAFFFKVN